VTLAAYLGTYAAAWLAAQAAGVLAFVRFMFGLIAPADVAEFLARPYVFSGLCLVLVAVIANGTKLLMWWVNNSLKLKLVEQQRLLDEQSRQLVRND
jgi:hypothetical protein